MERLGLPSSAPHSTSRDCDFRRGVAASASRLVARAPHDREQECSLAPGFAWHSGALDLAVAIDAADADAVDAVQTLALRLKPMLRALLAVVSGAATGLTGSIR